MNQGPAGAGALSFGGGADALGQRAGRASINSRSDPRPAPSRHCRRHVERSCRPSFRFGYERCSTVGEQQWLGLERRLRNRAEEPSMGERQRVMIARALSTRPELLLADEPTGSLDTQRSREVLELLVEVCREQDVAVLLVTHDPQAAAFADAVLALRDGRLVDHEPEAGLAPGAGRQRIS